MVFEFGVSGRLSRLSRDNYGKRSEAAGTFGGTSFAIFQLPCENSETVSASSFPAIFNP